jgi:hypothetical protein
MAAPMQQVAVQGDRLEGVLAAQEELYIRQTFSWGEACTGGCCEVANVYMVFGGADENGPHLFTAKEQSGCWERCCCAPNNSLKLNFFFPEQDINDENAEPAYVVERPGCCSAKPCVGGPAWFDCCLNEMKFHRGNPQGDVGEMPQDNVLFTAKQAPCCEAMFEPVIQVTKTGATEPNFELHGPMCFGGCSELCCSSKFYGVDGKGQEIGTVKKLKPETLCQAYEECVTDSDRYSVKFTGAQPDDKTAFVVGAFLADFMLFEQDNGMCKKTHDGTIYCTLFQCYCFGCIHNCNLMCKNKGE